jgi:hypothetical protein
MYADPDVLAKAIANFPARGGKGNSRRGPRRPATARALYLCWLEQFKQNVEFADLTKPMEFHGLLWLAIQLGVKQIDLAEDQAVAPASVNRWVQGAQTPDEDRRSGILQSAIYLLDRSVERSEPVPMRQIYRAV